MGGLENKSDRDGGQNGSLPRASTCPTPLRLSIAPSIHPATPSICLLIYSSIIHQAIYSSSTIHPLLPLSTHCFINLHYPFTHLSTH